MPVTVVGATGAQGLQMGSSGLPETAIVHPLVLLSAVDHYNRVAMNTNKRVVGVLLGQRNGSVVNVANSFAVPFDEDEKDPAIWFLDHNFLESMTDMFKKINGTPNSIPSPSLAPTTTTTIPPTIIASEKIVGWYHSGPKLRASDLEINEVIKRYTPNPVLVVIDVFPKDLSIPTEAYVAVEEIHDDGTETTRTFNHINSDIQAEEAEEIGVEHLLRDVKDIAVGTLSTRVSAELNSLKGLQQRIEDMESYLGQVVAGKLPVNHTVLYNLQNMFNLLPNLEVQELVQSFTQTTNDELLVVYVSSLVRSVLALHNLINNKVENRESEQKENEPPIAAVDKNGDAVKAEEGATGGDKKGSAGGDKGAANKKKTDK